MRVFGLGIAIAAVLGVTGACIGLERAHSLPEIPVATPTPAAKNAPAARETAVFAGGCFWGVEGVYEHVKGVVDVKSGYAGGTKETANYEDVGSGTTGHAESVQVTFDPSIVTYEQLLYIFFTVAHNPTELNFQGPDHGPQYRSAIFFAGDKQKQAAAAFIKALTDAKFFDKPIVTELKPLDAFYPAEEYHQDYMRLNPDEPYIVVNDRPKVDLLKHRFPELFREDQK
ncbi:MAG: methionine sulfoxide reductase A [Acidobacteria bacterium OLB17]|nr:MAG: methionine sulfoxide reductase A [Acidobacteria bacterium OLB17]MCZ2391291.1 peptide-methionine (S)-S-oxide reductase MsrA [Acidobacteriota bacterium]